MIQLRQIYSDSPDGDDSNKAWSNAMLAACERGDLRVVKKLYHAIEAGNLDDPLPTSERGNCPLEVAIIRGNPRLVRLLTSLGAKSCSSGSTSPLGFACYRNQAKIVRLLLRLGADPNAPVHAQKGFCEWTITPLILALSECDNNSAKALLQHGADPNVVCEDFDCDPSPKARCTPLLLAEVTCNTPAKRLLLAHGADPELAGREGISETAFRPRVNIRARFVCPTRRVIMLIRQGKDLDQIAAALRRVSDLDALEGLLLDESCKLENFEVMWHLVYLGADSSHLIYPIPLLEEA